MIFRLVFEWNSLASQHDKVCFKDASSSEYRQKKKSIILTLLNEVRGIMINHFCFKPQCKKGIHFQRVLEVNGSM